MIANLKSRLRKLILGVDAQVAGRANGARSVHDEAEQRFRAAWARHVDADADGAIEGYRDVLRVDPAHGRARENLGVLLLARGEFNRFSWECYGAHLIDQLESVAASACPPWNGGDVRGRSITVYGHQGLGDQVMFASCIPDLIAAGARVTLVCDARLAGVFRTSFPQATVQAADPAAGMMSGASTDLQCPLGKLARYFRDAPGKFPARAEGRRGYLRADAAKAAHWRQVLDSLGPGPKVGISWSGGNPQKGGRFRSIPLAGLEPVLRVAGAHWVSLQYGDCDAETGESSRAAGVPIHHWPLAVEDLDETAGLVSALDLVISVTTSVAHLAGAMGCPVWLLVPARAQWRWLLQGETMPWYPSARLFRQQQEGDWRPVVAAVRDALHAWPERV